MAGPTKKPRKPSAPDSDGESMSDESDSGSYHGQQEIQATFEGRNPEGQDFHGIKQLLNQLFLKAHVDLSQFSDMIISQNGLGTVLKQSLTDSDDEEDADIVDESDVFGITSVLNLTSHRETPCVQQFYNLLDDISLKYGSKEINDNIKELVKNCQKLGFLINERFVNIPAKISVSMLNALCDDLDRVKKRDSSYDFEYFVMICKTYREKSNQGEEKYSNDEEEIFAKEADINFEFSVEKETDTGLGGKWLSEDKQVIPYRRILVFRADKLKQIVSQITAFVQ